MLRSLDCGLEPSSTVALNGCPPQPGPCPAAVNSEEEGKVARNVMTVEKGARDRQRKQVTEIPGLLLQAERGLVAPAKRSRDEAGARPAELTLPPLAPAALPLALAVPRCLFLGPRLYMGTFLPSLATEKNGFCWKNPPVQPGSWSHGHCGRNAAPGWPG